MAIRIVGVDLPQNKRGEIALTYIYGIGRSAANSILSKAGIDRDIKLRIGPTISRQRYVKSLVPSIRWKVTFVPKYN